MVCGKGTVPLCKALDKGSVEILCVFLAIFFAFSSPPPPSGGWKPTFATPSSKGKDGKLIVVQQITIQCYYTEI